MKLEHIAIKEDGKAFRIINRALLDKELTELPKGKYRLEYANNIPIKTRDESLIEGKLLATEKHLEDMREFSKTLLGSIIKTTNHKVK